MSGTSVSFRLVNSGVGDLKRDYERDFWDDHDERREEQIDTDEMKSKYRGIQLWMLQKRWIFSKLPDRKTR